MSDYIECKINPHTECVCCGEYCDYGYIGETCRLNPSAVCVDCKLCHIG